MKKLHMKQAVIATAPKKQIDILFGCFFGKFRGYKLLIRSTLRQFPGVFKNILKKLEALLLEDQIFLPGILIVIPRHDRCDGILICLFKLRCNDRCDLFRAW